MFAGRYKHHIDQKGRLALPVRLREAGSGICYSEFVVTKGVGGCMAIFPVSNFEQFLAEFNPEGLSSQQGLNFYREFSSWAHYVNVDAQGRINLPQMLIDNIGLEEEVLVLGVVDWIEVWNPLKYAEHLEESGTRYDDGAMQFFSSLIRGKRSKKDEDKDAP